MSSPLAPPIALWVVPVSELAGVGRHVVDAFGHGIPGWRGVLLCPPGPLAELAREAGIAVLTGPVSPADGAVNGMREVRRVVQRLRPQIVHSHLSFADLLVAGATVGLPVKLVTTEHGIARDDLVYHGSKLRSRVKAAAHTARLRRFDALIAVSKSTLEVVREKWHPPASLRTAVVYNGVNRTEQPVVRRPGLHIVSASRLAPEKGLPFLVDAFALLTEESPDARLTIAGNGPDAGSLQAQIARLGLADKVVMPGYVPVDELLPNADVLAQLSTWENCSYALLDAQVHGLGVVATQVGGNPELLPRPSLVNRADIAAVAHALKEQGSCPASRPTLAPDWPTIAAMCTSVGRFYKEIHG